MAHGRIIQISTDPIDREDWVEEDEFYESLGSCGIDFVYTMPEKLREMEIQTFVRDIQEHCSLTFKILSTEPLIIEYQSGIDEFKASHLQRIRSIAQSIIDNPEDSYNIRKLAHLAENPLGDGWRFIEFDYIANSDEFISLLSEGKTTFYIGNILDFHY